MKLLYCLMYEMISLFPKLYSKASLRKCQDSGGEFPVSRQIMRYCPIIHAQTYELSQNSMISPAQIPCCTGMAIGKLILLGNNLCYCMFGELEV